MSATLTWRSSGLGIKTGTTNQALLDDLDTLITSKSGDSNFKWEKASKNSSGASPLYLVLRRKDAAPGRVLLVIWTSAPAGNNAAILDQAPIAGSLYCAFFPSGNADTPSNLTASSGTVLGNDSGAVKVGPAQSVTSIYQANVRPYYFDGDEALIFAFQDPSSTTAYVCGTGLMVVDDADAAYAANFSSVVAGFSIGAGSTLTWSATVALAGSASGCVRTNYGSANRAYFNKWAPSGVWANQVLGPGDILSDTALAKSWFAPVELLGQTKGEGGVLKLRQIAFGPGTTGALSVYDSATLTPAARQLNAATAGVTGYPWLTNFKL